MGSDEFYDRLAADYGTMTGRGDSVGSLRAVLEALTAQRGIRSAVDAGCGTGHHAVALALLGVRVLGVDSSAEMIRLARDLAAKHAVDARFERGDLRHLHEVAGGGWDCVLCLGNTIPHLTTKEELRKAFESFAATVRPGGWVIVQMLNYPLFLDRRERIVAISREGDHEFVRFYDYLPDRVRFNVLCIRWKGSGAEHELLSTDLKPYRPQEVAETLQAAKLDLVGLSADLSGSPFGAESSRNVVIFARRGGDSV